MAGHSKWANIKRHKAKVDAKKGKIHTKVIRELTVAAKLGGGDAATNPRLRAALEKAYEANMTKDVVERAIKRGAGGMEGENVEEVRYEGYGPAGTAVMVDCMTNNRNRTVGEVRHAFAKHGGNLGTDGSVAYLFKKEGQITFAPGIDEDAVMTAALELDAQDVNVSEDGSIDVITTPETFFTIKENLTKQGFQPAQADITMLPATKVAINDKDTAEAVMNLMDALEDLDDVQQVYSNADIAEAVMSELSE